MIQIAVLMLVTLNAACVLGDPYIMGGRDANITEVPYQVLVLIEFAGENSPRCGGSIISENIVLSAAHCFKNKNHPHYVRYGSSYRSSGGTKVKVSNITTHKQFNSNTFENDIALLFLEKPIKFNEYAQKIALPNFGEALEDGTMTTISGWGRLKDGVSPSEVLQIASVSTVNIDTCTKAHTGPMVEMICAADFDNGGIDACDGDSGGPLAAKSKLYGISSWGKGCGRPKYPGVFTDVAYFRKWIDAELKEHNA